MREEIGLEIPVEAWLDAGERTTPPFFPVRYRTKFWIAELPEGRAIPKAPLVPEELEAVVVCPPARSSRDGTAARPSSRRRSSRSCGSSTTREAPRSRRSRAAWFP
jgi:hypothetical protein